WPPEYRCPPPNEFVLVPIPVRLVDGGNQTLDVARGTVESGRLDRMPQPNCEYDGYRHRHTPDEVPRCNGHSDCCKTCYLLHLSLLASVGQSLGNGTEMSPQARRPRTLAVNNQNHRTWNNEGAIPLTAA